MDIPFKADIQGKVAVITGGAGVLCSEFARALAACGAKVAVLNRTPEKGRRVAEQIRAEGGEAIAVRCDVLDKESIAAAHGEVFGAYGKCDILINGAGGNDPGAVTSDESFDPAMMGNADIQNFFDLNADSVSSVFSLNFMGALLTTQAFAADMVDRPGSVILNISSMSAYAPLTKVPAYSGAKAAVTNFTQWLAVYFAQAGIRVNAMAPGFFSTRQNAALLWQEDGSPTARTKKILDHTPMGRLGVPQDLIGTLLYLVDNNCSSFVTGVVVPVDGGFNAYSGV